MDNPLLRMYAEVESRMLATSQEATKTCNIDIETMVTNLQQCLHVIERLLTVETETHAVNALTQLKATTMGQVELLMAKIRQLKEPPAPDTPAAKVQTDDTTMAEPTPVTAPALTDRTVAVKSKRQLAIEETLVKAGHVTFDDVAGLHEAKQALQEAIIMPLLYPQLFTGGRQPWRRILLYGPPGTGKSRLAQAISSQVHCAFYSVSSADLVSSWVGESEKLIKELFHQATTHQDRSVIFIDEIDSICRQRSAREEEYTRRIKTELLKQMEGVDSGEQANKIFLLCATNCPWELDPAFLRRFQRRIFIPLPDRSARLSLLKIHCQDKTISMSDDDWGILADKTAGYSGSDIAAMVLGALFEPLRRLNTATHWLTLPDGKVTPCDPSHEAAVAAMLSQLPPDQVRL